MLAHSTACVTRQRLLTRRLAGVPLVLSTCCSLLAACSAPDDNAATQTTTTTDPSNPGGVGPISPVGPGSNPSSPSTVTPVPVNPTPTPDPSVVVPQGSGGQSSLPSGGGAPGQPSGSGGTPIDSGGASPGPANSGGAPVGVAGMNVGGDPATGGSMNPSEDIVPTVNGNEYTLTLPSATLVANGPTGRITQLLVGGTNRLTTAAVNPLNYGSSFWTAPQSVWNWPPPLDAVSESVLRMDYAHAIDGNSIAFSTPTTTQGSDQVSITKRFSADAARDALVLEYTITNEGAAAFSAAPWEITRVAAQGLTFYPTGTTVSQSQIPTTDAGGVTWLDYSANITNGTKNIADGAEGWLAHVDDGVLFLKVFPEIPAASAAPGEGEIEIYVDSTSTYVELEQQGAYEAIAPGTTTMPWRVLWVVRSVPAEAEVSVGSATLVEWVRGVVAGL